MTGLLQRAHRRNLVLAAAALLLVTATAWPAVASATTIPAGNYPVAIAVNSVTNKIYVANFSSNDVTVIDGATNSATTVGVGQAPIAIAVNSVTNKIYVANFYSATVTVIDGATNSTATVAVGASPNDVAVNSVINKIYVANSDSATVTVIDGMTNSATTVAVHSHPSSLAVNPLTNEVYVTCPDWWAGGSDPWGSYVDVLDGSTNAVTSVSVGYDCSGIAVNAITNKVYVPCLVTRSGYGYATMYVIDGATKAVTAFAAGIAPNWPGPVAINSVTNKIYMPDGRGDVSVIDGATNAVTLVAGCVSGPFAVAVNTATNRTYIGNGWGVTVLDGASNLGTIATGSGPDAVAVDSVTNKIYVANASSNDVTVIDGMTSPDPVPAVPGNDSTQPPILVLIAGLNSDTGYHADPPLLGQWELGWSMNGTTHVGDPWEFLRSNDPTQETVLEKVLGVSDVLIAPTAPGATQWPSAAGRDVIDSTGSLDRDIDALITWLRERDSCGEFDGHKIILCGHSYGGVIARDMLACGSGRGFGPNDPLRKKILGIIQIGSPNGGSPLAPLAGDAGDLSAYVGLQPLVNLLVPANSDAMYQLNPSAMKAWNTATGHHEPVKVPVVRLGGDWLDYQAKQLADRYQNIWNIFDVASYNPVNTVVALDYSVMGGSGTFSDGLVAWESLVSGYGSLQDPDGRDFGGGFTDLAHGLGHAELPLLGIGKSDQIVPQSYAAPLFNWMVKAVGAMTPRATPTMSKAAALALAASTNDTASSSGSCNLLPARDVTVAAGSVGHIAVALDTTAAVFISSTAGTPTVVVHCPDGTVMQCPGGSVAGTDSATTMAEVSPPGPGLYTFDVTLPPGKSGTATLSGIVNGGAQLTLASGSSPYAGEATTISASFISSDGSPLTGATVMGTAHLDGQPGIGLTLHDDGTGGDALAGDGIYTATFSPPVSGRWSADVSAVHSTAERAGTLVFDVGDALASVTGAIAETTTPGPGSTLASFGVTVPLQVSADGIYTVSADLSDAAGRQVGTLVAQKHLDAGESTTMVMAVDASQLSGIATGKLTVSPLRITRRADANGIDLEAGSAPGLVTTESYSSTDFYAFSVSLDGPTQNPSPTHAVHFAGTALDTSSTVASVEFTIDGGATWQAATPTDGAFDSHAEDFTIDLDLADYVYGILVRQTGADGTQLPVADWAGVRFTVDTVAPAQVASLAAPVITEADSPVAYASWLSADPPSDTVSTVRYVVAVDGAEVGTTYDTDLAVPLADTGSHILTVTPVDAAGNSGPASSVGAAPDTTAPTTAVTGVAAGWHNAPVTVTLTPTDNVGGSGMAGGSAKTEYKLDSGDWTSGTSCIVPAPLDHSGDGAHTVSYRSTDRAGNTEVAKSVHVNIDTTPPVTTDDAGTGWHAGPWSLALTATDPPAPDGSDAGMSDGSAGTQYSLDNGASWQSGTSVAFPRWKRGGGSGTYDVLYRSTDAAGNTEQTKPTTVFIDNSLPTSSVALTTGGNPATVTLTATDPDSGVACLWYSLDGGDWQQAVYPGPAGVPLTIAGLGTHTLCYYAVDVAGNPQAGYRVATVTNTAGGPTLRPAVSPLVDTTAPTTAATGADADWRNTAVTVTLAPTDDAGGSGMTGGSAKTEYKLDAGDWTTGTSVTVAAPLNHSDDGAHTLSYRSTDAAGNTEAAKDVTVNIDTTPPTGDFTLADGAATTRTTAVSGDSSVTDAHGPLEMRFSLDGEATWSSWEPYEPSTALTLPAGLGTKTVSVQYRDAAGNVCDLSDTITLIAPPDTTPPTVVASGVRQGAWYRGAVLVTLTASDSDSGVASVTYSVDGVQTVVLGALAVVDVPASPNRLHTLSYHATDTATNSGTDQMVAFTTDTHGPVTAGKTISGRKGKTISLRCRATDNLSPTVWAPRVVIKNARGKVVKTIKTSATTSRRSGAWFTVLWKSTARGPYRYYVYAKDLAGNVQSKVGSARVTVR